MNKLNKEELAKTPNTSIEILKELSKDNDKYVRMGVADNPTLINSK